MKSLRILGALPALVFALPCHAAWVTQLTLTKVGSSDVGGEYTWFSVSDPLNNPAACASTDIYVVRSLPKNALAILLAAHASGKRVWAYVSDTSCDGPTGRPLVVSVAIQD